MNQIDTNDLQFAKDRGYEPTEWDMPIDPITGKINPQVTRMHDGSGTFYSVFHVKPVYYETIDGYWRPLSEVCSWYGNHKVVMDKWHKVHPRYINWLNKRMKLINGELLLPTMVPTSIETIESLQYARIGHIGLTTTTVYPDPDPETTTVDGHSSSYEQSSDWDTAHDYTTGNNLTDSGTTLPIHYCRTNATPPIGILRLFYLYDTSAVGTDTVSSATNSHYAVSKSAPTSGVSTTAVLVQSSPASNTVLVNADYDQCGAVNNPTEGASRFDAYTNWTLSQYNDISLNATGISWIDGSGVTKLGIRHENDADDATIGTSKTAGNTSCYTADQTGTTTDPKLAVTHTVSSVVATSVKLINTLTFTPA